MTFVLDAGALIALDRNDRAMWRRLKSAFDQGEIPITRGGVVGQAWKGSSPRSAFLAKALSGIDVQPLDGKLGKRAGELLALAKKNDVIDAALVLLAADGDTVVTSDASDLEALVLAAGRLVELLEV